MPRQPKLNYESRIALAKQRIHDKPQNALKEIGKFLVKEIKLNAPRSLNKRMVRDKSGELVEIKPGRLKKSFSYWFRKREGDLQVGSKAFYAPFIHFGTSTHPERNTFFTDTVEKNVPVIQGMIADTLKELNKD